MNKPYTLERFLETHLKGKNPDEIDLGKAVVPDEAKEIPAAENFVLTGVMVRPAKAEQILPELVKAFYGAFGFAVMHGRAGYMILKKRRAGVIISFTPDASGTIDVTVSSNTKSKAFKR